MHVHATSFSFVPLRISPIPSTRVDSSEEERRNKGVYSRQGRWRRGTCGEKNGMKLSYWAVQVRVERETTRVDVANFDTNHLHVGKVATGKRQGQGVERGGDRRMDRQGRKTRSCPQNTRCLPLVGLSIFLSTQGAHKCVHSTKFLFSDAHTVHVIPLGTRVAFHHV